MVPLEPQEAAPAHLSSSSTKRPPAGSRHPAAPPGRQARSRWGLCNSLDVGMGVGARGRARSVSGTVRTVMAR